MLAIASCAGMLMSCHNQSKSVFFSGTLSQAFEEAARQKKYLLVVSENEQCPPCVTWNSLLTENKQVKEMLADKYLLYRCVRQVKGNEILSYSLNSVGSPTTILYNQRGEIGSIITGNKKEDELITELYAFENERSMFRFYTKRASDSNHLGTPPKAIEKSLQAMLAFQAAGNDTSKWRTALTAVQAAAMSQPYFYNCYLSAMLNNKLGDKSQSRKWALKALELTGSYEMLLYRDLLNETKTYADTTLTMENAPYLAVAQSKITLGVLKFREKKVWQISVYNKGKNPLLLHQAVASCSCLSAVCPKAPIAPGDSAIIQLSYDASSHGVFNRGLSILSNARNTIMEVAVSGVVE
ncbi:thioredoxin-related protein [Chitinophaga dinghuensis]|uniref:Thioredoxin-related protein n=1 Tax=Chitinophaga dinghuensis TaxID=1539050 RepID=A0A327VSI7_9BACT|nr:DUF1573 domain-containing protein [Chitinophaga dinghuensis]RAJ77347.1 thioredoxin-related protein [Chitinophaga dinghuensis]